MNEADIVGAIAIGAVAMIVIFVMREYTHHLMCMEICNGDEERAKKLHDEFHKEGGI